MSNGKLIERLKKILRLAEGGTEGERDNAIAMARQISIEHGIDLAMVKTLGDKDDAQLLAEEIIKTTVGGRVGRSYQPHEGYKYAAKICNHHFNVRLLYSYKSVIFLGPTSSVQFAEWLYTWLLEEFTRRWQTYIKSCRTEGRSSHGERKPFYYGLYQGLDTKLYEAANQLKEAKLQKTRMERVDTLMTKGIAKQEAEVQAEEFVQQIKTGYELMIVTDNERTKAKLHEWYPKLGTARSDRGFSYNRFGAIKTGRIEGAKIKIPGSPLRDRGRLH